MQRTKRFDSQKCKEGIQVKNLSRVNSNICFKQYTSERKLWLNTDRKCCTCISNSLKSDNTHSIHMKKKTKKNILLNIN